MSEHAVKRIDSTDAPADAYEPPAVEDLDTVEGPAATAAGVTITNVG